MKNWEEITTKEIKRNLIIRDVQLVLYDSLMNTYEDYLRYHEDRKRLTERHLANYPNYIKSVQKPILTEEEVNKLITERKKREESQKEMIKFIKERAIEEYKRENANGKE